ncbi:MAG TPA: hypothetical protein PKC69_04850 [Chitinophagaceae bacterium]|nr:hypothetical protein [Chitinophagaceae bacterium]
MKPVILFALVFFLFTRSAAAQDTIRLHFLYGSKPAKGFKDSEKKLFGGLKGGHVNIQVDNQVLDFMPGDPCAIVPNNAKPGGGFRLSKGVYWDTANTKWSTVYIPVSGEQKEKLLSIFKEYAASTPYDYAVFGMRCAAASYDVLSEAGLFKRLRNPNNVMVHFYPKLLRKKIYRWAENRNYRVVHHEGRTSRKWETDNGIF